MTAFLIIVAFLVGLLIGSFLNVVIHRVPRGESIVRPRSRCPGCGTEISSGDNIPVLSWLLLRGHCRRCGEPINARYPAVELLTGLLFAAMAAYFGLTAELPVYLYLAAVGVALSFVDFDTKRLPNAIVLPSYGVVAALLLLPAAIDDMWSSYLRALLGGLALFAFYLVLALVYPAGMGFGDVKLAGVLGMCLAWLGWDVLIVGAFLGFLLGGVVGGAMLVARRAGRKSQIPFGPFMITGTLLAVFVGATIGGWYTNAVLLGVIASP